MSDEATARQRETNPSPETWAILFGFVGFFMLQCVLLGLGIIPNKTMTLGVPGAGAANVILTPLVVLALFFGEFVLGGLAGLTCLSLARRFQEVRLDE